MNESASPSALFECFIHDYYNLNKPFQNTCWDIKEEIQSVVLRNAKRITVDFNAMESFDEEFNANLCSLLLSARDDDLDKFLKEFEEAINGVDRVTANMMLGKLPETEEELKRMKKENWLKIGIKNLPETLTIAQVLEEKHQGRLVQIEGVIQNIGIPFRFSRKKVLTCEKCGFEITKIFEINERKPITKRFCPSCGTDRIFNEEKEREITLKTQLLTTVEGVAMTSSMPISLLIVLFEDLLDDPDPEKRRFIAGSRIKVVGILKEMKSLSPIKKIYLEALWWDVETEEIRFTDKDIEEFKKISKEEELIPKLVTSFCPSIYGYEDVKLGMILQVVGGVTNISEKDKKFKRGNIHILLVGDPSTSKSTLSLFVFNYIPKTKYAVCSEATSAGLGVAMLKDKLTESWYISAGVLPLSHHGIGILDEIDKATPDDIKSLDTVMSLQKLPVSKAGINITLPAETSVLAIANPKGSRWDEMIDLKDQVNLSEVTLSRFDVKYCFKDRPNLEIDGKIADVMINSETIKTPFDSEFLAKYLIYAKTLAPKLTTKTTEILKKFYMEMRQKTQGSSGILVITSRQFEGMMRLSEAFAKIRLADKTNEEDAENAINVFKGFLRSFGFNYETGDIDIDKAEGRTSGQKRKESRELSEIYKELTAMFGNKVPMLDFVEACEKEGIRKAEKKIRQRISEGEFTEPEYGFVKRA